jgi:voltage-gated potassium channel Kch
MTLRECELAAKRHLSWLRERGRAIQDNGQPSPVRVMPLTLDVLMGAVWEVCPDAAATDATWQFRVAPDDVCYVVKDLSNSADARAATVATWGSQVKNLFIMSEAPDDAAQKTVHVPALVGKSAQRRTLAILKAANNIAAVRDCKFVALTSTNAWTNPRVVAATLQGVSPAWPVALAFFWNDMGFVDFITSPAQGYAVWSRSAWEALAIAVESGACAPDTQKTDDILMGLCALDAGVVPVNLNNVDNSGAMVLNGVPLEPGPPGEQMSWLQQPHNRAGHWMSIEGTSPGLLASLWNDFKALYGPWGRLVGGAPSASPSPPRAPAAFVAFAGAAPCAARATLKLRAALDATRTSATVAMPLTVDVAAEITAAECNPLAAPGAADPPPPPGSFAHTVDHNVCVAVQYSGMPKVIKYVARGGWGWRMRHKEDEKHRRLWIFGGTAAPELYVYTIPGFNDGDANDAAYRNLVILRYLASLDAASVAHCEWWYVGGTDIDWVNPRALANTVRDLHADSPVAVGLWLHKGADVDVPATGRVLVSRAALAALGAAVLTPACARTSNDFAVEVARCLALTGGVPVHSYAIDVAGMAVGMDWAYQQEMYLMGWGVNVNMGLFFSQTPTDNYPWRMGLLEMYYSHLFGALWNVTAPEFYVVGDLGDHGAGDGGVGDMNDGSVVEGDGDGWRRALEGEFFATEIRAEQRRIVERAARA